MSGPGLNQSFQQRQTQQLMLAPQMRQSLKILQVAALDLRATIQEELQANPTLEEMPMDDVSLEKTATSGDEKSGHDDDPREAMEVRTAVAYAAKARGPRRRPDAGWASLTPAEQSVVELAVQGLNNVEIAARLFIGRGTVKTHLAHVYAKLQVANRIELARLATERRHPANG